PFPRGSLSSRRAPAGAAPPPPPAVPPRATRTILVSGATGRQGGAVVRALLALGYPVRGLTRNLDSEKARALAALGVTLVKGDLDDPASLRAAVEGAYGVFSVTDFWEHGREGEIPRGSDLSVLADAT